MKKNFEQPELMVVRIQNNDIITESFTSINNNDGNNGIVGEAADRYRDWE